MADYVYNTNIHLNSLKKIMAGKAVWQLQIKWGPINKYSLYYNFIFMT